MDTSTHDLAVLREPERIAALMDPARRRLLVALEEEPDSAVGLARRLGDSRQRLNYHLRQLEEAGVVELAEERPRRGVKERILRPVARRFVLDSGALGALAPEPAETGDRFSATWLVALAARAVRELADLLERARSSGKRLPTAGMSVTVRLGRPGDFDAFVEDLSQAVGAVVSRYHTDEGEGRAFRLVAGVYPGPDDKETTG